MNIAAAAALVNARAFSTKTRKSMAERGTAKPDGSYPIANAEDVKNAVSDFHRFSGSPSDKAHIRQRAKSLGMGDPFSAVKAGGPGSGRHPGYSTGFGKHNDMAVVPEIAKRWNNYLKDNLGKQQPPSQDMQKKLDIINRRQRTDVD